MLVATLCSGTGWRTGIRSTCSATPPPAAKVLNGVTAAVTSHAKPLRIRLRQRHHRHEGSPTQYQRYLVVCRRVEYARQSPPLTTPVRNIYVA